MGQLIDKATLVAEIERRKKYYENIQMIKPVYESNIEDFNELLSFLNTLEVKEVGVWKTVDNINPPQADRNKLYCVLSKNKYLLARVINHPHDELLQWRCTEFPFNRYDMCEGDKYMQIG